MNVATNDLAGGNDRRKGLAATLVAAAVLALALAALPATAPAATPEQFREMRQQIEAGFVEGGDYAHLTPMQRRDVISGLEYIEDLLRRHGSIDAMNERTKVRLFNRQEKVNRILSGMSEDEQVVCDRVRPAGTHMSDVKCGTLGAIRERRESDQARLRGMQRASMPAGSPPTPKPGGN